MKILLITLVICLIGCISNSPTISEKEIKSIQLATPSTAKSPMVKAAVAFLGSLSVKDQKQANFPLDYAEREQWNFVPLDNRKGMRIGYMTASQRKLAFDFLKTGLSEKGYDIAREIMDLENILVIKENQKEGSDYRNPTKYYLTIFGTPSDAAPWGWKYEGHHLSLNYTSVSGKLSVTPSFWGANPGEIDIEHPSKGKRVLGEIEDRGRAFMQSLDAEQQRQALISEKAYPEVVTGTESYAKLKNFEGLPYTAMTDNQQIAFEELIKLYASLLKPEVAVTQLTTIKKNGLHNFFFAWAGSLKFREKHYYRLHGPHTIIEYDNEQGNGNHVHFVWRDTEKDFGRDLLRAHHLEHSH